MQPRSNLWPIAINSVPAPPKSDIEFPAHKVQRLLSYIEHAGLDPAAVASAAGIDLDRLGNSEGAVPSLYYALLYKETVARLEADQRLVPWAAGLGSQAFRLMCYCIITCPTLDETLHRAEAFDDLVYPVVGHGIKVRHAGSGVELVYNVDQQSLQRSCAPAEWSMAQCLAVARTSGIETWLGLCGWLIGRSIEPRRATVAGPPASIEQARRLGEVLQCPVQFEASDTLLELPARVLTHRVVHGVRSLEKFLETGPYQLWSQDEKLVSTTAAIRSLLGTDFSEGLPSFDEMARQMHMSPSTLRRHLLAEGTSYQKIKDRRRRDLAVELLCLSDAKVSEIGELVGFADTSSFVRSFRAWTGTTPRAYRDQSRPLRLARESTG